MKKVVILFMVSLMLSLFFINFVYAVGISSPYSTDRPLTVYSGEVKNAYLKLMPDPDKTLTVTAELVDDQGIASFVDRNLEYSVLPGKPVIINIRLRIPEDAAAGKEYLVKLKFTDITPSEEEGTVDLRIGSIVALRPKVVRRLEEEKIDIKIIILLIFLIVAVSVIIWFVVKSRKVRAGGARSTTKAAKSVKPSKPAK